MGRENRSTVHHRGSWVPSLQIFIPRSLLADRLHYTWRVTPEQIGSVMWLGLGSPIPCHSPPFPCYLPFPTLNPQNSNLPALSPLPLRSELTPEENSPQVLPPLRTYMKLPLSSTHIQTPLAVHTDCHSTSFQISVPNPTQATANIFLWKTPPLPWA